MTTINSLLKANSISTTENTINTERDYRYYCERHILLPRLSLMLYYFTRG